MKKQLFSAIILTLALAACQDPINVNVPSESSRLVIEGIVERKAGERDSAFQRIKLTESISFFAGARPPLVRNAEVFVISSDGRETRFTFSERDSAYITNSLAIRDGISYRLRVTYRGDVYETGGETARRGGRIDSIFQKQKRTNAFDTTKGIVVAVDFTDPADITNFYFIKLFKNGRDALEIEPGNQFATIRADEFFNGQTLRGIEPEDDIIFQPNDTALVKIISLNESLFEYLRALFIQTGGGGGGPFNPPPAPVRSNVTNITNSARFPLGYFGVGSTSQRTLIIQRQP
jgi:hypothetical protein